MDGSRGYYAKQNKTQRKISYDLTYMWNLKNKANRNKMKTDSQIQRTRLVVARVGGVGEMGEGDQKAQTSSYKINKFWGCNVQHGDYS